MIRFEQHKKNIDTKPGTKEESVSSAALYSGEIGILKKYEEKKEVEREQPLAAAIVGLNNTGAPLPKKLDSCNMWTDIDAQELFLSLKPTCYIILGKPGAGAFNLGQLISKKYNCIHLSPKNILDDEIEQKSSTGKCVDFNMKHNKAITIETFLKMLKVKLDSSVIQHRGYVISGFPLVTSSSHPHYLINTLHGEEGIEIVYDILFDTIANLKKKQKKIKQQSSTESVGTSVASDSDVLGEGSKAEEEIEPEEKLEEEEEELKVELPKFLLDTCSDVVHPTKAYYNTKKTVLLKQLENLFDLKLKPDLVIYLSCPDKDMVMKKSHMYFNYKTQHVTFEPFCTQTPIDRRWPSQYATNGNTKPISTHTFQPKYAVRHPIDFQHKSVEQMCNYNRNILPFLERKLKDLDPKCVIKIDARTSHHEMMHEISERLLVMPTKPVIIPEPLLIEEPPEEMDEFWKMIEELDVISSGAAKFNRRASPWYNRCPVDLKKRKCERGNPKLAISFLKYVYLPSSLDNMISFYKNPCPYLKLRYLEPTCRIIVIGTKLSGKTMISECLSWLFDTPIISYNEILQTEIAKKYDVYAKTIYSEIIATIEDDRYATWQNVELERLAKLEKWCKSTTTSLKKYIALLKEYLHKQDEEIKRREREENRRRQKAEKKRRKKEQSQEEGVEEEEIEEAEEAPPINAALDTAFMNKLNTMKSVLYFLPFLDKLEECEKALSVEILSKYAPKEINTPNIKPALPVLGDKDVTDAIKVYIETNELQKEIEPTLEELMSVITGIITSIDVQHQQHTNMEEMCGKYIIDGFPSDAECWSTLAESELLPDYTIALVENREIEPELIQHYKIISNCMRLYQERYILANDPLIKTKLLLKVPPDPKNIDMKIIVHDFIRDMSFDKEETADIEDGSETEPWLSFSEKIEKFKEDWDTIKIQLEENNKCFIETQLENKSDIEVVEEVMLKLRKCYYLLCEVNEDEEFDEQGDEDEAPKDLVTYNNSSNFGETGIYCPIAYYEFGVLWEGKPEFSVKFDTKAYRLCKEENLEPFQNDVTKYQFYNKPFKIAPPLRICIVGCIGSGKTTVSKMIAKELGLIHIDFFEILNDMLMPKHFKRVGIWYENCFTDVPIDDEAVVEFQMDEGNENLISDIMSSETELRKMVYNYFERGSQILPQLMQKLITKLWFEDPFVNTGFVLDGYPRLPTDVEDMLACYCIPDIVIELECSSENTLARHAPNMLKTWKMQLSEAKEKAKNNFEKEKKDWMDFLTKNVVVKLICDEILENMFLHAEPVKVLSAESVLIDADPSETAFEFNLVNTFNELLQVFPKPVDQSEWEKVEDVRDRIDTRLEGIFESDDENIQALKDLLVEQRIRIVSIDGNKSLTKVTRLVLSKLTDLRNRNESFFEQTFVVSPAIAEILLSDGLCFLSNKFNRMCPVHIFENPNAIQNVYNISKRKNEVFPVVHRCYVYFMYGQENLKKFRTNPLKYVTSKNICDFIQYPLRISVIGTPKSGKSTLSAKLAKQYGLICFSKGAAINSVLNNERWTELGSKILSVLTTGECVSTDHIGKAVLMRTMDYRTITNGFVFDGFPETASEAMELEKNGIYPEIVLDISADIQYVGENSQKEIYYDLLKLMPPYSRPFIENRYTKWKEHAYNLRDWIQSDYQNLYKIDGNTSKWKCVEQATNIINDFITKIHIYLTNVNSHVVRVDFMCVSNAEFRRRMSPYKHMCPLCYRFNILKHNENPVIKKGLVQYEDKFYWICPAHINQVLNNPLYLRPQDLQVIPELPLIVKRVNMALVYEKGVCIVTYAEHLPAQVLVLGTNKHAASYRGNRYLFCSKSCHDKFLAKPHLYYDITVFRNATVTKPLTLKGLPNLGYLEQTVGMLITEACVSVTVHRPKYPGLTYQLSALLHIAFYLKTHNPNDTCEEKLKMYEKASKFFDARCKLIPHVGLFLRSMDNPFASYPKCCGYVASESESLTKQSSQSGSSTRSSSTNSRSLI